MDEAVDAFRRDGEVLRENVAAWRLDAEAAAEFDYLVSLVEDHAFHEWYNDVHMPAILAEELEAHDDTEASDI